MSGPVARVRRKKADAVVRVRTPLSPEDEKKFQKWYQEWALVAGIDPDPDNPAHKYDYRGAYRAGIAPSISPADGRYHWPSQFKDDDHPNRFVPGFGDTKHPEKGVAEMMQ